MDFLGLHPGVFLGTAGDRYPGWVGLVYAEGSRPRDDAARPRSRRGRAGGRAYLPVESVREYFDHFPVLELGFTYHLPPLNWDGSPNQVLGLLEAYGRNLRGGDRVMLLAPRAVISPRLRLAGGYADNPEYLDPDTFTRRFLEPAARILGTHLAGTVFVQGYRPKRERTLPGELAARLDAFFGAIPGVVPRHLELRTAAYLAEPVFEVLMRHGVGQVLSHWTWLPPLEEQFKRAGRRYLNPHDQVIRLVTPHGVRSREGRGMPRPFDRLVPGTLSDRMVEEAARLMGEAVGRGVRVTVIADNRAGGSAPLVLREVAGRFRSQV